MQSCIYGAYSLIYIYSVVQSFCGKKTGLSFPRSVSRSPDRKRKSLPLSPVKLRSRVTGRPALTDSAAPASSSPHPADQAADTNKPGQQGPEHGTRQLRSTAAPPSTKPVDIKPSEDKTNVKSKKSTEVQKTVETKKAPSVLSETKKPQPTQKTAEVKKPTEPKKPAVPQKPTEPRKPAMPQKAAAAAPVAEGQKGGARLQAAAGSKVVITGTAAPKAAPGGKSASSPTKAAMPSKQKQIFDKIKSKLQKEKQSPKDAGNTKLTSENKGRKNV